MNDVIESPKKAEELSEISATEIDGMIRARSLHSKSNTILPTSLAAASFGNDQSQKTIHFPPTLSTLNAKTCRTN